MSYFDNPDNVEQYIKMAEDYDGRELIDVLRRYLPPGATVLELGMGPGKDLELLREYYSVTGSDNSQAFLNRYLQNHPNADLMLLDAAEMCIERQFDGIYSNKVLHHLTQGQVKKSFECQAQILCDDGIALHSFWYGNKEEEFSGLRFVYYNEQTICDVIGVQFELADLERYTETDEDDSFYIVLRKK